MDKKNVQKSICRNLFAQKRAALGNLRNFFGDHFARPYMVRGHAPALNPRLWGQYQKSGFPGAACPFWGVSYFRKKGFGVLGTVFGANGGGCMSLLGGFLFPEKRFWRFGDCLRRNGGGCMSLLGGFLFPEKRFWRFQGVTQSLSDPSSGASSSSESKLIHEA
jgi:hypothetical protein